MMAYGEVIVLIGFRGCQIIKAVKSVFLMYLQIRAVGICHQLGVLGKVYVL